MIQVSEDPGETPLCPHCEKPVRQIGARKLGGAFGVRYLYFCRECRKVLGVSHRKGFWMG